VWIGADGVLVNDALVDLLDESPVGDFGPSV
jgi:hypothetical protein